VRAYFVIVCHLSLSNDEDKRSFSLMLEHTQLNFLGFYWIGFDLVDDGLHKVHVDWLIQVFGYERLA
jgi:hypothetical protein